MATQSDPVAALLSEDSVTQIRRDIEQFFALRMNALVNDTINRFLTMQTPSGNVRLNGAQIKILAIRYCEVLRDGAGFVAGRFAKAVGERHGLGAEACERIMKSAEAFVNEKASPPAVSLFAQEIVNRFTVQNAERSVRLLQLSVTRLAHPPVGMDAKPDPTDHAKKVEEALKLIAGGQNRASRHLRRLSLSHFDVLSEARNELQSAQSQHGSPEERLPRKIRKKRGRPHGASEETKRKIEMAAALSVLGYTRYRMAPILYPNRRARESAEKATSQLFKRYRRSIEQEKEGLERTTAQQLVDAGMPKRQTSPQSPNKKA